MLTGLRWHVEESLWKEHRTWANMKHIRQTLKRGQAPLRNRWPAALGGVIIGLQGRSLLDLAGSCDSRRAWLQDGLFPAWCTSQRHIREAKPDGLWTPVVCVCVCVFFLATKLKLHLGIYPPFCWSRCEPCSEIPVHSTDYLPGSCLKCSWAQWKHQVLLESAHRINLWK